MRNVGVLGIEQGMSVADFGSGSGAYTLLIAEALKGYGRVYAVDVQRDLLRRIMSEATRRGFKNVEVLWADLDHGGSSKIADGAIDLVLISNLLFQLEDKEGLFAEVLRVLRPAGRMVLIDWADSFGGMGPEPRAVVTKEKAFAMARGVGFELQREFNPGAHHYGIIMRKGAPKKSV